MTQDSRTITNKLRWEMDNASVQATVQANTKIAGSFSNVADAAAQLGLSAEQIAGLNAQLGITAQSNQAVATQMNQAVTATKAQATAVQDLTALYKALDDQAASTGTTIHDIGLQNNALPDPAMGAFAGDSTGGGSGLGGLTSGRRGLTAIGSLAGGAIGGDLGEVARLVSAGAAFGPLGVAAGGAAILVKTATDAIQKNNETEQHRVDVLEQVAQGVANATTQEVQARVKAAQDDIRVKQIEIGLIEQQTGKSAAYLEQLSQLNVVTDYVKFGQAGLGRELGDSILGYGAAASKIHAANQAITDANFSIDTYNKLVGQNVTAANDASASEKQLADARAKTAQATIGLLDQDAQMRLSLVNLRNTGADQLQALQEAGATSTHALTDQVYAQIKANQDRAAIIQNVELPALSKANDGTQAYFDKVSALNTELVQLAQQNDLIKTSVLGVVEARQNELNLLKAYKDASDALNPILQDINTASVGFGNASVKTASALAAVGQAETDHRQNLIDIQNTFSTAEQDALSKKNTALAKIDQQAAERQKQQRANDNLSILQAISRGDLASAQATLAQQHVKDEQDKRQVQQQKDDAQTAYNDALAQAKTQNTKLLSTEAERYSKELTQRQQAYNQAYQDQQALSNRLQSLRSQEAFQAQYNANIITAAMTNATTATGAFAAQMQAYAASINNWTASGGSAWQPVNSTGWATVNPSNGGGNSGVISTPGAGSPLPAISGWQPGTSNRTITQYAVGTPYVPYDQIAYVHKGEKIIPAGQNGGNTLTFNVADPEIVERIVTAVKPVIERSGENWAVRVVTGLSASHAAQKRGGK